MTINDLESSLHKVSFNLADMMLIYELYKKSPEFGERDIFKVDLNLAAHRLKRFFIRSFNMELDETVFKNLVLDNYEKNLRDMYLNMN